MVRIELPHSPGDSFDTDDLKKYIRSFDRNYIIQGDVEDSLVRHKKPQSLDYWLRTHSRNPDTKQAVNELIITLIKTGEFRRGHFTCPDSGEDNVQGIRLSKKDEFKSLRNLVQSHSRTSHE